MSPTLKPTETEPKAADSPPGPASGKLSRIADEARGLVEDTREWVDAKLKLFELEFEEKIDGVVNRLVLSVLVASLGLLALAFALTGGALALGTLWGSDALGFLAVSGGLAVVAAIVFMVRPKFVKGSIRGSRSTNKVRLPAGDDPKQLAPPANGKADG
jgi:putative superfamily III holin-X